MTGRRDRHGRGLRGPVAPASSPASVTRMERFGDLVGAAVDRLEPRWRVHVAAVDVEIQDAPPVADAAGSGDLVDVPLAGYRLGRGPSEAPVTVVVFRRPVEAVPRIGPRASTSCATSWPSSWPTPSVWPQATWTRRTTSRRTDSGCTAHKHRVAMRGGVGAPP